MYPIKKVYIDSRFREPNSASTTQFNYKINRDFECKNLRLSYAKIPCAYYNVAAQTITMNDGIGSVVNLPAGNYSITELCAEIQAQLQVFDANYTVAYNAITMRVTFANTTPRVFDLDFGSLDRRLGFDTTAVLTGASTYTATKVPQMLEDSFFITVREFSQLGTGFENQQYTYLVPSVATRADFNIYRENEDFDQHNFIRENESYFTFSIDLRFPDGSLVDLNGADWQLILSAD